MKYSILTMKRVFLAILLIAVSQATMAQSKTINRTILDSETKEAGSNGVVHQCVNNSFFLC